jgi:ubiquitin carboxyl-terminal hydrolase 14
VFVEDMPADAVVRAGVALPAGLQNLGNTCYANSALQCLRAVPELRGALDEYRSRPRGGAFPAAAAGGAGAPSPYGPLTTALADLFVTAERARDAVVPAGFLTRLRAAFPQFGETGPQGGFKQQDSEEFASALMTALASELTVPSAGVPALDTAPRGDGGRPNVLDTLFGLEFEETLTCREAPEGGGAAEVVVKHDYARRLQCNIEGGAGRPVQVNHLHEGITLGLGGEVEKAAPSLGGRNAVWGRAARLDLLPRYLCVQMMRFYWKATPESRDHTGERR